MKIKQLIKHIVTEIVSSLEEEHQKGEWWIDEYGGTQYADGDVGDMNHEAVVIRQLNSEILSHFGVDVEDGTLNDYEDRIKESLKDDGRLTSDEELMWDNTPGHYGGASEIIIKKLVEDKVFFDAKQAEDAVYIAYGSSSRDARTYAMKYWKWKVMKTFGKYIEIQSWTLTPDDLGIIVKGVHDIMEFDTDDAEDSDNEVGDDGYAGPRLNITVASKQRRFHDVPLAAIEKKLPSILQNYKSGLHSDFLNENYHHHHPEYRMYEGHDRIIAIFEDNSRLFFDIHYRDKRGPDKEKHRKRALSKWRSLANELHRDVQLSDAYNPIQKTWKECFAEALKSPELEEFIRNNHHQKIFDDKGYPASVQGKPQACVDPVNFTP